MKDSTKNSAPIAPSSTAPGKPPKARIAKPENGTLVKKKNTAAGDPTKMAKPSRNKVTATSGARYGIRVKFQKSTAPEAAATQGNGRLLPSSVKRSAPNFSAGMSDHN
jgi:hypothetical protein